MTEQHSKATRASLEFMILDHNQQEYTDAPVALLDQGFFDLEQAEWTLTGPGTIGLHQPLVVPIPSSLLK